MTENLKKLGFRPPQTDEGTEFNKRMLKAFRKSSGKSSKNILGDRIAV